MIVRSVHPLFRPDLDGLRVVQWKTEVDPKSGKEYHTSNTYTIRLYNSRGTVEEHNRPNNIDVNV